MTASTTTVLRTLSLHVPIAIVAMLSFHCLAADRSNAPPVIVVRQFADYPDAGRGSVFPAGLVAALWSDGRMIRPMGSNTVGKSYVEGMVSTAERDKFFDFLNKTPALRNQEADGERVPLHAAYQTIRLRRDGKASHWMRPLPDRKAGWYEVEARLWSLPLQEQRAINWRAVRSSSWYE
jgi:hypothetical protein